MSFTTVVWKVKGKGLDQVARKKLDSEKRLEDWLEADLGLVGKDLLLIGRQVHTSAGIIDLLAIDENEELVILELKRDKTPHDVVAQTLHYGSWASKQNFEQINLLFASRTAGKSLSQAFTEKFGYPLSEDACTRHKLVIVASELDDSSESIVGYLAESYKLDINVVFFNIFEADGREYVTRSWLADPEVERNGTNRPWSGLYFVNTGMDHPKIPITHPRHWENCRKYGYLTAGGAPKW